MVQNKVAGGLGFEPRLTESESPHEQPISRASLQNSAQPTHEGPIGYAGNAKPLFTLRFYVGLHQPSDAKHFDLACISINRLRKRKSGFEAGSWIMDSGAFTEVSTHGGYRSDVKEYAAAARRWIGNGDLEAIVAQDWMCEPWVIEKTGLSVKEHQRLTIERYDALLDVGLPVHVLPVLQGYQPSDYTRHREAYGDRLKPGMWVGVGSVCKRNGSPIDVVNVLEAVGPGLLIHGFGLKKTALLDAGVRRHLYSADSMAWSYSARKRGANGNDWREAKAFELSVMAAALKPSTSWQPSLPLEFAA